MDDNILELQLDDNVGNGLSKINYNLLNINQDYCNLNQFFKDNNGFLKKVEDLMDDLDVLMPKINYDYLEKLEATVQVLSSYWDKLELTVQYPFNPVNGFISSIINAGEFGALTSYTNTNEQTNLLADAMVREKLFANRSDAKDGINDKDVVFVRRDNEGTFTRWDYLDESLIFNFSVDREDNFYYNGRLVDLYKLPYYSVIAPKNTNLSLKGTTVDFDDKIIRQNDKAVNPDKTSITKNSYISYSVITKRVTSETDQPLDVTKFTPTIKSLNEIIQNNNPVYKAKVKKINDDTLESSIQNPFLNTSCLRFLNKSYSPQKYMDGTIINVVLFLYNTIGLDTATATIETNYFAPNRVKSIKKTDVTKIRRKKTTEVNATVVQGRALSKDETLSEEQITRNAPSSNTTFNVNFKKSDVYVDRIVLVKYRKNSRVEFNTNKVTKKVTSKVVHFWEFVNANLGPKYSKNNESVKTVDNAPIYVRQTPTKSELLSFPTQVTTLNGDILGDTAGNTFLIDNIK